MQDEFHLKGSIGQFDPELHRNNAHDAFCEFVSRFQYEYEAIAKEPPADCDDKVKWIEINKRKVFLGRFSSRNLQRDYETAVDETDRPDLLFKDFVKKMKDRYEPTRNYTLANYQFHRLHQHDDESFDNFVHRLRQEATSCNFKCASDTCNVAEVMIRDQIIVGTTHDDIRKNALKKQWQLKDLVENGRKMEAASHTAKHIQLEQDTDVPVSRIKPKKYSKLWRDKPSAGGCLTCSNPSCSGKASCLARKITCFACGLKGHFKGSRACKGQKAQRVQHTPKTRVPASSQEESSASDSGSSDSSMLKHRQRRVRRIRRKKKLMSLNSRKIGLSPIDPHNIALIRRTNRPKYVVKVTIAEHKIKGFADTGADLNVMSEKTAKKLDLRLRKTKTSIRPFGSKPIKCLGYYEGFISIGDCYCLARFYVVPLNVETLLSGDLCEELGIIEFKPPKCRRKEIRAVRRDRLTASILEQYPEIFAGVGTMKNYEVHFYEDTEVPPVAQSVHPVPYHLRSKFRDAISQMEKDGIIEEHEGPAPWISNPVLTPKDNGDIRVTIDMRAVNEAIMPTNIPIPRVEDIKAQLCGCKIFSKLDFKSAFHQLKLDKASRALTVFHAGQRLMRYRKLPMGAKPASGELTKALMPLFSSMPGVHVIHDDIIIAGRTAKEHDTSLHAALQCISSMGMTLNPDKCIFRKKKIPFWGMIVTDDGVKPDPAKVQALKHASRPQSKEEVMSFLCFVQSFGDFIPLLSRKTANLRLMTKKHQEFHWSSQCERDFRELRKCLHEDALLRYFDTTLPTYIFVDAHSSGISAILAQGKDPDHAKPVTFASRATRPEEQRYPQLDLEATAIDFGLRRFRCFITGGPEVMVLTDHKPLVSIFGNSRKGSIRTDRIKLRHQDIPFQVSWKAGQLNPADYLSRHAQPLDKLPSVWQDEAEELERTVFWLKNSPYTEAISMERIRKETTHDVALGKLKRGIRQGWLDKKDPKLQPYLKIQDQLTIVDGLVMKQDKIILPQSLWKLALEKAHQGHHPGITRIKRRIREYFWFPGLNKWAEDEIKQCKMCQLFTNRGTKQPQKLLTVPINPWDEVSVDLFGPMPDKRHILVVQDTLTRFPDAKIIPSTGARHVIPAMQEVYKQYGRPLVHKTDNGPPFNGQEFKQFSESYGIRHKTSYPLHPQANPVETFMKTLGKCMKICHTEGGNKLQSLDRLLADYRSMPHIATGQSPGNLMLRGGYKHVFPKKVLSEAEVEEARATDVHTKITRQTFINSSCKRRATPFTIGDKVILRNHSRRKFDPLFGPTPYKVISVYDDGVKIQRLADGKCLLRHINDVKLVTYHVKDIQQPMTGDWWLLDDDGENNGRGAHNQIDDQQDGGENEQERQRNGAELSGHNTSTTIGDTVPQAIPRALSRLADYNSPGFTELGL